MWSLDRAAQTHLLFISPISDEAHKVFHIFLRSSKCKAQQQYSLYFPGDIVICFQSNVPPKTTLRIEPLYFHRLLSSHGRNSSHQIILGDCYFLIPRIHQLLDIGMLAQCDVLQAGESCQPPCRLFCSIEPDKATSLPSDSFSLVLDSFYGERKKKIFDKTSQESGRSVYILGKRPYVGQ